MRDSAPGILEDLPTVEEKKEKALMDSAGQQTNDRPQSTARTHQHMFACMTPSKTCIGPAKCAASCRSLSLSRNNGYLFFFLLLDPYSYYYC